ncbi:hypothetical protein ACO0RG_003667 [Hanseniaspora osmophila]
MKAYSQNTESNCKDHSFIRSEGENDKTKVNPRSSSLEANFQSQTRSRPSCCIFVASLPSYLSDDALWVSVVEHFEKFGDVAMAKVLRDNKKRPYAFVQYHTEHEANAALLKANNSMLQNRRIRCEKARVNRTLVIEEKFPVSNSEKAVLSRLEKIGEIEKMVEVKQYYAFKGLLNNHNHYQLTSNPCRSWYFQFAYRDDAISAHARIRNEGVYTAEWTDNIEVPDTLNVVQHLQECLKEDKKVYGYEAQDIQSSQPEKNNNVQIYNSSSGNEIDTFSIFIGQLPSGCTEEELAKKFGTHGEIESINLFTKQENNSFAFIQYKNEKSASFAIENENHSFFKSKTIHVQFRERNHVNAEKKRHMSYFQNNSFGMDLPNPIMPNAVSYARNPNESFDHKQRTTFNKQTKFSSSMRKPDDHRVFPNTPTNRADYYQDRSFKQVDYKRNKFEKSGLPNRNFKGTGGTHEDANLIDKNQQNTLPPYHLQPNFVNTNGPNYTHFVPPYYYNPNVVYYPNQGYSKENQTQQDYDFHDDSSVSKFSSSGENPTHLPEKENGSYSQIASTLPETFGTSSSEPNENTYASSGAPQRMPQPMLNSLGLNQHSIHRNYDVERHNHPPNFGNPAIMLPFAGNHAPGMFPVATQPPLPSQVLPFAYGAANPEFHSGAFEHGNVYKGNFHKRL